MENDFLLTRAQILSYRTNGFLVVEDVLTSEQCDRLNDIFESHARDNGDKEFKGIMNLDREDRRIRDLMSY